MSESKRDYHAGNARRKRAAMKGETDYARLDAMTDEDIARAVAEDPDAAPVDADWSDAWLTIPAGIQHDTCRSMTMSSNGFATRPATTTATACAMCCAPIWRRIASGRTATAAGPRINHVALKVADLDIATRFYENVFGFRQVKTGRSRGHISRHLTDGYVDLALMLYDSEDDPEAKLVGPGPAIHHFGVAVADRRAVLDRIGRMAAKSCPTPTAARSSSALPTARSPRSPTPSRYDRMKGGKE